MTEEKTTEENVVTEVLSTKTFKQTPETREYFRNYKRKIRLKNKKCSCGEQAVYKSLETKKNLCLGCLIKEQKEKECIAPNSNTTSTT